MSSEPWSLLVRCERPLRRKVRYVFDTLLMAAGVPLRHVESVPESGPWIDYGARPHEAHASRPGLFVAHDVGAWAFLGNRIRPDVASTVEGLPLVFAPATLAMHGCVEPSHTIGFDLAANAFYFLCSWAERRDVGAQWRRQTYALSESSRLGLPQDVVDRYMRRLIDGIAVLLPERAHRPPPWPGGSSFAVALSHDVDFLPARRFDNARQGVKTVMRHLVRHRDPGDAWRAARGWCSAMVAGRDPYGCVPQIIARERELGVRSSFQVAVGRRHADDVNYDIMDDHVRDYLTAITDAGFDLCLHGSIRSTENVEWYVDEARLLARRLAAPLGSRQHFLAFDYDALFTAQEAAGIRYDMSMGYADRPGPRAGFSYPYFPYNLAEDRPYSVVQISLFLMDVTLRGYMGMRPAMARKVIDDCLAALRDKGGCASVVWHPIVFGGARDPGYDTLYYDMATRVGDLGGLATDGRTIHDFWRARASAYASFQ